MKYDMKSYQDESNTGARRLLIFLGVLLVVAVVILIIWWIGWKGQKKEPAATAAVAPTVTVTAAPPTTAPTSRVESRPLPTGDYRGQYCYAGEPRATTYPNPLQVLTNIGYVVAYDNARKDPVWVCYRLFKVSDLRPPPRPKGFSADTRTRAKVSTKDYIGSGFDRGHNAPNRAIGVCYGDQAQLQTFLMSNILPEEPRLNQQVWEHLETAELMDYAQRYGTVWIITGPVFGAARNKLTSGVIVPDACYKIMVREDHGTVKVLAFEVPQTVRGNEEVGEFRKSVRDIEQDTGLNFLTEMPKVEQDQVELTKAGMW